MKVKCVNKGARAHLTDGKVYDVVAVIPEGVKAQGPIGPKYRIVDDYGEEWNYAQSKFEVVEADA